MQLAFTSTPFIPRERNSVNTQLHSRRPVSTLTRKFQSCQYPRAQVTTGSAASDKSPKSTEETFAIDAGRDLFFPGMDGDKCIDILNAPLGSLQQTDDRYIAAERIKFYASEKAVDTIISFVRRFDQDKMEAYGLEDKVARRKSVESLGRHKGKYKKTQVIQFLQECLKDIDPYLIERAIWSLAEIGIDNKNIQILDGIVEVLDNEKVAKRVVIQTLMRANYVPAIPKIRNMLEHPDPPTRSAAMTALAMLSGDQHAMGPVVDILKQKDLNMRRSALQDITLSEYVPALQQVAVCPNSIVLRSRTVRVLLDVMKDKDSSMLDGLDEGIAKLVDKLIWDHPNDLDLLGEKKETRKARDPARNIRQLYKNDALSSYTACQCLATDHRNSDTDEVAVKVKKSYDELGYFDYFGAYHVYKTLGWLRFNGAYDLLLDNAANLPPRFFNHKFGAVTALAELGNMNAIPALVEIAKSTDIWELKYACLLSCERLGDTSLRSILKDDQDWLVRSRARTPMSFDYLRTEFK